MAWNTVSITLVAPGWSVQLTAAEGMRSFDNRAVCIARPEKLDSMGAAPVPASLVVAQLQRMEAEIVERRGSNVLLHYEDIECIVVSSDDETSSLELDFLIESDVMERLSLWNDFVNSIGSPFAFAIWDYRGNVRLPLSHFRQFLLASPTIRELRG